MSENKKRILSGAVLTVLIVGFGLLGGVFLLAGCLALSLLGMKEFYACVAMGDKTVRSFSYGLCVLFYLSLFVTKGASLPYFVFVAFIFFMFLHIFSYPKYGIRDTGIAFFGLIYVAYLMSFLYLCRVSDSGFALYGFCFICSWLGDTCAYSVGRRFGKHKMIPNLSPKKSWEGFIGGVLGCTIAGALYGFAFKNALKVELPVLTATLAAFFGQLVSVAGDLSASAIKREFDLKDYSQLIPGHGGVLDRFDSVLFAAPFVYLVFSIMENIFL